MLPGAGAHGAFAKSPAGNTLSYTIAAYVIVIGALVAYGLSVQAQRRKLMRQSDPDRGEAEKI